MAKIERNKDPFKEALMPPVFRVQLVREPGAVRPQLDSPQDVVQVLCRYLKNEDREHFVLVMLDVKNRMIGLHTVSIGTLNCSVISAREVFKAAILSNAASIIVAHNHPSGDVTPSVEDIQVTNILKSAGKLLDIELLDHIIVGEHGTFSSLRNLGHL